MSEEAFSIDSLYKIIRSRKNADSRTSYTADLFQHGIDRITQKVGEEAIETVIAGKNLDNEERLISEMADLWYHCLVLLAMRNITPHQIYDELEKRSK